VVSKGNDFIPTRINELFDAQAKDKQAFFVVDQGVGTETIKNINWISQRSSEVYGINTQIMEVPGGEQVKNGEAWANKVIAEMNRFGLQRKALVVLVGGGAVLDMSGFAASKFHRGVRVVRIPTTLLSQIDAGIGVKNGVNYLGEKNLLGFFQAPSLVVVDPLLLAPLDQRQMRAGLTEAVKIGVALSEELLKLLEANYQDLLNKDFSPQSKSLEIMWRTIVAHLKQIETDPTEMKDTRPLDLGHQWGHRLEMITGHRLNHGEAVAVGIALDSHISAYGGYAGSKRNYITAQQLERILGLFENIGLPIYDEAAILEAIWPGLQSFRRHLGGQLTISLIDGIGKKKDVHRIYKQEVRAGLEYLQKRHENRDSGQSPNGLEFIGGRSDELGPAGLIQRILRTFFPGFGLFIVEPGKGQASLADIEQVKEQALTKAAQTLKGRNVFILQMEYGFSMKFLQAFREHLENVYGSSAQEAAYNTGELAKVLMAGGLGSFKPDLVRGWYQVLSQYWGSLEARSRLHVMGVLYAQAIKGQGRLRSRGAALANQDIVEIARNRLTKVKTYSIDLNIQVNSSRIDKIDVEIYKNPYSELEEYWLYSPRVFHEAYPGEHNDDYRAVQALLYRKVVLKFIEESYRQGTIAGKLLFSTSEVNTTLAVPAVVDDEYRNDPEGLFSGLIVHHYNHTIVAEGIPWYKDYMFDRLKIAEEFRDAIADGKVDLVEITGRVSDFITGSSSKHTRILRESIFSKFAHKVIEDDLFGNSEGSDIERWQGEEVKRLISDYMQRLNVDDYSLLFEALENNPDTKSGFIAELLVAKREQKRSFIKELFKGTFSESIEEIGMSEEEFEPLIARPFFTFVRRFVDYKSGDLIIDILYQPEFRERVVRSGAVIFIGGRRFSTFASLQQQRIRNLIQEDPRMRYHIIYVSNHNVFSSWLIQQGTDFGGMLSWKGKEAGPTSYANAQQNGAPTFASPDGVIPERVQAVQREAGEVIGGNGYIVDYEDRPWDDGETRPSKDSFIQRLEQASSDYSNPDDYGVLAFNALRMGMTEGDIRSQAKGLIRLWAKQIEQKTQDAHPSNYPAASNKQMLKPTVTLEKNPEETTFRVVSVDGSIKFSTRNVVRKIPEPLLRQWHREQNRVIAQIEEILAGILARAPPEKAIRVKLIGEKGAKLFTIQDEPEALVFTIHWVLLESGNKETLLADIRRHESKELENLELPTHQAHQIALQVSYQYFRTHPQKLVQFFKETEQDEDIRIDAEYRNLLSPLALEQMAAKIAKVVLGHRGQKQRPVNILFVGPPGSLKSEIIVIIKYILESIGLTVAVEDEAYRDIGEENSFRHYDEKHTGKDVVIVEAVKKLPADEGLLDLFIRLNGSYTARQVRITDLSNSYHYAQIRTEAEVTSRSVRESGIVVNTDFVTTEFLQSGKLKELLESAFSKPDLSAKADRTPYRQTILKPSALKLYNKYPILQEYEPQNLIDTLKWLTDNRDKLGGNSLRYLIQALTIADRLPKDEKPAHWRYSAAAYDFYLKSELLQGYEIQNLEDTLRWLNDNRSKLGGNSLGYLMQALIIADRLPESANTHNWQFAAGAYDFYLQSKLLQDYKVQNLEDTLRWLNDNRSKLGDNSLSYLVLALDIAGRLPEGTNTQRWQFSAAAFDRAVREKEVIRKEIHRIWSNNLGKGLYRTDLARLRALFNPELLLNLRTKRPLSASYRNMILGFAYNLYGEEEIKESSLLRKRGQTGDRPGGANGFITTPILIAIGTISTVILAVLGKLPLGLLPIVGLPVGGEAIFANGNIESLLAIGVLLGMASFTPYRQTILPGERGMKLRHLKIRDLHQRTLELALRRFSGEDVSRKIGALKRSIRASGIQRAKEIIGFIEKGNEPAALAILAGLSMKLKKGRKELLTQRFARQKTRPKIEEENDGQIAIWMGRVRKKGGATVVEQRPETRRLYRWQRILDQIFARLADDYRSIKELAQKTSDISIRLHQFAPEEKSPELTPFIEEIEKLKDSLRGVKIESKQEAVREMQITQNFLKANKLDFAFASLRAALTFIDLRLEEIDGEIGNLEHLRFRLREIGQSRFSRVSEQAQRIKQSLLRSKLNKATIARFRGDLRKFIAWPFLSEPDFMGVRNLITRTEELLAGLKVPLDIQQRLFPDTSRAVEQLVERLDLVATIVDESAAAARFMADYNTFLNQVHLGKVKGFGDDEAVFNKIYRDWAKDNDLVRGSPRYWRARLYKTAFISERSPVFHAADTILLSLKVDNFGRLIRSLQKNKRNNILNVILVFLNREPPITYARRIPVNERNSFLEAMIQAAREDFKLDQQATPEDISKLYRAFQLPQPAEDTRSELIKRLKDVRNPEGRLELAEKLNLDTRPIQAGLLDAGYVGHDMAMKEIMNPDNRDLVAVYGGSGADISNFLLSTNATTAYFVDHVKVRTAKLREWLDQWSNRIFEHLIRSYLADKAGYGFGRSELRMKDIEMKVISELKAMGVPRKSIKIHEKKKEGSVVLEFDWAYRGQKPKRRKIIFLKADITRPRAYPKALKQALSEGIDLYYQRAAFAAASSYKKFLPGIARSVRKNGFLALDGAYYVNGHRDIEPSDILSRIKSVSFRSPDTQASMELNAFREAVRALRHNVHFPADLRGYGFDLKLFQRVPHAPSGAHLAEDDDADDIQETFGPGVRFYKTPKKRLKTEKASEKATESSGAWVAHSRYPVIEYHDLRLDGGKRFDQIDNAWLKKLAERGVNVLWLSGVYEDSEYSQKLNEYWGRKNHIRQVRSAFSISEYTPKKLLGGKEGFDDLVARANGFGIKIGLDVVLNHLALDSPIVQEHPEYFLSPETTNETIHPDQWNNLELDPADTLSKVFIHPQLRKVFYFGGGNQTDTQRVIWLDTIQFNYLNENMRAYMRNVIFQVAEMTNGGAIRLDAVFHLLRLEYKEAWFKEMSWEEFDQKYPLGHEAMRHVLQELKRKYPNIILISEYFGGRGDYMLELGFDFYYEGYIREALIHHDIQGLKKFLSMITPEQKFRFLKYLENHDLQDRITRLLGRNAAKAATVLLYTLPGASLVMHGQSHGHSLWMPSATYVDGGIDFGPEQDNEEIYELHRKLGMLTSNDIFRNGLFELIPYRTDDNNQNVVVFKREWKGKSAIVVVNYSDHLTGINVEVGGFRQKLNLSPWGFEIIEIDDARLAAFESSDFGDHPTLRKLQWVSSGRFADWYFQGNGLKRNQAFLYRSAQFTQIRLLSRHGRASFSLDPKHIDLKNLNGPQGGRRELQIPTDIIFVAEQDPNHGRIVNLYSLSDFTNGHNGEKPTPISTYVYPKSDFGYADDELKAKGTMRHPHLLAAMDVVKAARGDKLQKLKRITKANIVQGHKRDKDGFESYQIIVKVFGKEITFMIPSKHKEKIHAGDTVIVRVENDINQGQIIRIYLERDFLSLKKPEVLTTYQYREKTAIGFLNRREARRSLQPIDLAAADLWDYHHGNKDIKPVRGKSIRVPVNRSYNKRTGNYRATADLYILPKEFALYPNTWKLYEDREKEGRVGEASIQEHPDYGPYIEIIDPVTGTVISTYYRDTRDGREEAKSAPVNFDRLKLWDYVLENTNVHGDLIAPPDEYYVGLPVPESGQLHITVKDKTILPMMTRVAGKDIVLVAIPDEEKGYLIDVHVQEEYLEASESGLERVPEYVLVRDMNKKKLVISDVELERVAEKTALRNRERQRERANQLWKLRTTQREYIALKNTDLAMGTGLELRRTAVWQRSIQGETELSNDVRMELWRKMRLGDLTARDELIRSFIPYVNDVVARHTRDSGSDYEAELIQLGNLIVIERLDSWEPESEVAFVNTEGLTVSAYVEDDLFGKIKSRDHAQSKPIAFNSQEHRKGDDLSLLKLIPSISISDDVGQFGGDGARLPDEETREQSHIGKLDLGPGRFGETRLAQGSVHIKSTVSGGYEVRIYGFPEKYRGYSARIEDYLTKIANMYSPGFLLNLQTIEVWRDLPSAADFGSGTVRLDEGLFKTSSEALLQENIWHEMKTSLLNLIEPNRGIREVVATVESVRNFSSPRSSGEERFSQAQEKQNREVYQSAVLAALGNGKYRLESYLLDIYKRKVVALDKQSERKLIGKVIRSIIRQARYKAEQELLRGDSRIQARGSINVIREVLTRLAILEMNSDILFYIWQEPEVNQWSNVLEILALDKGQADELLRAYIQRGEIELHKHISVIGDRKVVADALLKLMQFKERQLIEQIKDALEFEELREMDAVFRGVKEAPSLVFDRAMAKVEAVSRAKDVRGYSLRLAFWVRAALRLKIFPLEPEASPVGRREPSDSDILGWLDEAETFTRRLEAAPRKHPEDVRLMLLQILKKVRRQIKPEAGSDAEKVLKHLEKIYAEGKAISLQDQRVVAIKVVPVEWKTKAGEPTDSFEIAGKPVQYYLHRTHEAGEPAYNLYIPFIALKKKARVKESRGRLFMEISKRLLPIISDIDIRCLLGRKPDAETVTRQIRTSPQAVSAKEVNARLLAQLKVFSQGASLIKQVSQTTRLAISWLIEIYAGRPANVVSGNDIIMKAEVRIIPVEWPQPRFNIPGKDPTVFDIERISGFVAGELVIIIRMPLAYWEKTSTELLFRELSAQIVAQISEKTPEEIRPIFQSPGRKQNLSEGSPALLLPFALEGNELGISLALLGLGLIGLSVYLIYNFGGKILNWWPRRLPILLADKPGSDSTIQAIRVMIKQFFKKDANLLGRSTFGVGDDILKLRRLIRRKKPAVILIRSGTKAFKDPGFVNWAAEKGVRAIIRMGAGVDNVDREATTTAGISLIRTHGNANSVANLSFRFLIAALAQEARAEDTEQDFAESPPWRSIFDVPLEQFLQALEKSSKAGRGEMTAEQKQKVFSSYSPDQAANILSRLEGKTIGLVGFGTIAQLLARKLNDIRKQTGIPFSIMATSPKLDKADPEKIKAAEDIGVGHPGEEQVLRKSYILSFHLPAGKEPYFNQEKLRTAAQAKILINTARQAVIDSAVWEEFFS
ncbi:MAG: alpha-amylase family glycosyl hydrolase, partial [Omnitrophica bacterium]|nr:alpha-amylase family glycosyl hydrolase [Candidatus Omnitrophota bacterium]